MRHINGVNKIRRRSMIIYNTCSMFQIMSDELYQGQKSQLLYLLFWISGLAYKFWPSRSSCNLMFLNIFIDNMR